MLLYVSSGYSSLELLWFYSTSSYCTLIVHSLQQKVMLQSSPAEMHTWIFHATIFPNPNLVVFEPKLSHKHVVFVSKRNDILDNNG